MWTPPRKYNGLRTQNTHAVKVKIPLPDSPRSLGAYWNHKDAMNARLAEMEDWCEEHCTRNWSSFGFTTWYFDRTNEAVLFKMIFGGK